ncbi:ATP-binding protein [Hydrogenimonas sp.]
MKRTLSLTIPGSEKFVSLAINFIKEVLSLAKMDPKDMVRILDACRELICNAVRHAYPRQMEGPIDIDVRLLSYGVEVSVHDMGMPFDYYRYMESPHNGGLKRIHTCIDELRFLNMGQNGKSFTIYKAHPLDLDDMVFRPYSDLEDESPASLKPASIQIRDYETGDEESISRLIYNNYTYSYYKALFYYPRKIRELNEREEIASVVAETREGHIVGHFALVKTESGNTAEKCRKNQKTRGRAGRLQNPQSDNFTSHFHSHSIQETRRNDLWQQQALHRETKKETSFFF